MNNALNNLKARETDDRTRQAILPKRIIKTYGNIANTEILLNGTEPQIFLWDDVSCIFENNDHDPNSAVIIDFGKEIHGTIKLYVSKINDRDSHAEFKIRFGESVMEALTPLGQKSTTIDHSTRDLTMKVGWLSANETNETGFRFVYIELLSPKTKVEVNMIEAILIYRDIEYLGSFDCDNRLLCDIYDTGAYTTHINMQTYLWEGIKRDRLVWIGDMNIEVLTILSVFGNHGIISKSLDLIKDKTPVGKWMNTMSTYTLWWINIQYNLYMWSGDICYLKEQQKYLRDLSELLCTYVDENGKENLPRNRFFDHTANKNTDAVHAAVQSLMCIAIGRACFLLNELGENETADICKRTHSLLKGYTPDYGGSKPAAAMLVCSEIADAKKMCKDIIIPGSPKGFTIFTGYQCLESMAMAEEFEIAMNCICKYWGGMIKMGATTFWEDFNVEWMENAAPIDEIVPESRKDIHGDFGDYCYKNFRHSLCHGCASAPTPWLAKYVLGINILKPGCREIRILPHLGNLKFAKGTFPTPYGTISVSHKKVNGKVITEYTAPKEINVIL